MTFLRCSRGLPLASAALLFGALALAGGCAPYLTPAAHDDFFTTPFRTLAPEAPVAVAAPARRTVTASRNFPRPPAKAYPAFIEGAVLDESMRLEPAAMVEGSLRRRGARFGTDGSVASLLAYMRLEQSLIAPLAARPGDVLFFAIESGACADHAGVVESVDDSGRLTFREVRGGQVRTSYVHPRDPAVRRAPDGRILNTFLRPRRADDPPEARYFAGEMLCAAARVRR